jgi:hypothetical protein
MTKTIGYRHGEIAFISINSLPQGLTESKTNVIVTGSHGNNHTFTGGKLYLLSEMKDFIIGYLVSKNTNLLHPEHSPKKGDAVLPDGIYEIRKQQEFTPEGLIPVID